ncbi:GIY-YIG nuclease family protein [Maricaulis sp.]|uniref:GIY-YIG nuclease family protein n=1 Tax=Maricaulis sp. TaxID=1486257 RepID=UPI0025BC040A|nr:GIY-YIG nuclease family protein [Maricaulis sp.]
MARHPCVYILASQRNGTLYIGVTGNIAMRIMLHKEGKGSAFTRKYKVDRLVWYEFHQDIGFAIEREKRLKNWHRQWKINLIERTKPGWEDLFETIQMWAQID